MYINSNIDITHRSDSLQIKIYGDNIKTKLFQIEISIEELKNLSKTINDATICGPSSHLLNTLKEISSQIIDRKYLNDLLNKKSGIIRFNISNSIAFFPWELLSNGKSTLGLKFQCARIPKTTYSYKSSKERKKAVIISEQSNIHMKLVMKLRTRLKQFGWMTEFFVNSNSINYSSNDAVSVFYYLGHEPTVNSTFTELLSQSPSSANIVWIDTCLSANPKNSIEIINRFKCSHFIGNLDFVPELDANREALHLTESFFENMTQGQEISEALRTAKVKSFESGTLDWSYPILTGDPKTLLFPEALKKKIKKKITSIVMQSIILLVLLTALLFLVSPYLPLPIHARKIDKTQLAAFNSLGVRLWTYKTDTEIVEPILSGDVVGDYYPEIIFGTNCFDIENNRLLPQKSKIFIMSQQGNILKEISIDKENIYSSIQIENMYEMYPETLIDIDNDDKLDIIWRAIHHDKHENNIELIAAESYCVSKNDLFSLRYWCRGKILDFDVIANQSTNSTELLYIAELNNLGKRLIAGNIELEPKMIQNAKNQSVYNRLFCLAPPWFGTNTMTSKTLPESKDFQEKWLFLLPVFNDETLTFEILDDKVLIISKNNDDTLVIGSDLCLYKNSEKLCKTETTKKYWVQFKELMNSLTNDFIENADISYNSIMENLPEKHYAGPPAFQYSGYLKEKGNKRRYREVIQNGFDADSSFYNFYRLLEYKANNRKYPEFWSLFNSKYLKYNEAVFAQLAFLVSIDQKDIILAEKLVKQLEQFETNSQIMAIFDMAKNDYQKAQDRLITPSSSEMTILKNSRLIIECYFYQGKYEDIPAVYLQSSELFKNDLFIKAMYYYSIGMLNSSKNCLTSWLETNDHNYKSNLFIRIYYPRVLWLLRKIAIEQDNEELVIKINMKSETIGGYGFIPPCKKN